MTALPAATAAITNSATVRPALPVPRRAAGPADRSVKQPRLPARRARAAALCVAAIICSAGWALAAAWIPLKAELAQRLLQRSWQHILAGNRESRPWPGADTRPLARLRVPSLGIDQLVLEGQSGRNLAFGPVWQDVARSGSDRVISGHRDTHFRFLRHLSAGDRVLLETPRTQQRGDPRGAGHVAEYVVAYSEVVDSRVQDLVLEPGSDRLSLVTCYPFDAPSAGGPLRLVVTAVRTR